MTQVTPEILGKRLLDLSNQAAFITLGNPQDIGMLFIAGIVLGSTLQKEAPELLGETLKELPDSIQLTQALAEKVLEV